MPDPTQVRGFIILDVAGEQFTLTGTIGTNIVVSYHREFRDAPALGSIKKAAAALAGAIGGGVSFDDKIEEFAKTLEKIPVLGDIFEAFLTATVRITDLEINTVTKTYEIGIALDFSDAPISVGQVTMQAFGLNIRKTVTT